MERHLEEHKKDGQDAQRVRKRRQNARLQHPREDERRTREKDFRAQQQQRPQRHAPQEAALAALDEQCKRAPEEVKASAQHEEAGAFARASRGFLDSGLQVLPQGERPLEGFAAAFRAAARPKPEEGPRAL